MQNMELLARKLNELELTALGLRNTVMEHFKLRDKIVKKFLHEQGAGVCPSCQHVPAEQYDNFSILRLPVPRRELSRSRQTSSLSQLISRQYSEEEQQPMKCSTCCKHEEYCPLTGKCTPRSYKQQRVLIKSPDILLVQLMRFDANNKLLTKVNAEDILELPSGDRYQIVSIGDHIGPSRSDGHYVLQLRDGDGWSTCDDSRKYISKTPHSGNNYIFAYKKLQSDSNVVAPLISQPKAPTYTKTFSKRKQTQSAKADTINASYSPNVSEESVTSMEIETKNIFEVLKKNIMDICKICNKESTSILCHLRYSPNCKLHYNVELLKQKQKEKHKEQKTNSKRNMRANYRREDEVSLKEYEATVKRKFRQNKRSVDEPALKKGRAEEQSKGREKKRSVDELALKKGRAEEQSKGREKKRSVDEPALRRNIAENKSRDRENKRRDDEPAFKKGRAAEKSMDREKKRTVDEPAFKKGRAEEKNKGRENMRSVDEPALKRSIAENKSRDREKKRRDDEPAFKKERADEQRKVREKKESASNSVESHRRRLFLDAIRDGPIYACVCCRRIRFSKQVKVFDRDEITEKSPLENIVDEAIGNPPEDMRVNGHFYICCDCLLKVSQGKVPAMSHKNGLDLVDLEGKDELKLTELENVLIAKNILFQMFVQLPKSRMTATKKQMVNIPIFDQDIVNTIQSLPRTPSDAGIVKVQLKRKKSMKNTHLEMFISPHKIRKALETLKRLGNKHYQFVDFDEDFEEIWRRNDPEGFEMVFGEKANEDTESDEDGEENENKEVESDGEEFETEYLEGDSVQKWKFNYDNVTTFVNDYPELEVRETDTVNKNENEDFPNDPIILAPGENKIPTNILEEQDWDTKSFPGLYPDGKMGLHQEREVRLTMQQFFQQRLLNFDRRFANTPSFVFSAFSCNEKNQLERNIGISFLRGKKQADGKYCLNDPYSVLDNMPGTPRYWQRKRYELISKIENLGPFHLFFTLSSAEKRWSENFTTFLQTHDVRYTIENGLEFCTIDGVPMEEFLQQEVNQSLHEFIRQNILTATLNFNNRVTEFIQRIVLNKNGPFSVQHYNYRVEFQLRGKSQYIPKISQMRIPDTICLKGTKSLSDAIFYVRGVSTYKDVYWSVCIFVPCLNRFSQMNFC